MIGQNLIQNYVWFKVLDGCLFRKFNLLMHVYVLFCILYIYSAYLDPGSTPVSDSLNDKQARTGGLNHLPYLLSTSVSFAVLKDFSTIYMTAIGLNQAYTSLGGGIPRDVNSTFHKTLPKSG